MERRWGISGHRASVTGQSPWFCPGDGPQPLTEERLKGRQRNSTELFERGSLLATNGDDPGGEPAAPAWPCY
jgi:hypothetical protein